jgi:hypothetical protein
MTEKSHFSPEKSMDLSSTKFKDPTSQLAFDHLVQQYGADHSEIKNFIRNHQDQIITNEDR